MYRTVGPAGTSPLAQDTIDEGTLARARNMPPGTTGRGDTEEDALLLDLGQMVLDLTGIIDPTPVSDGTNALISVARGDWLGAGLSGISMIPYVGDLAKAGKLGRWAETVHKAVSLARRNARFGERVRPLLRKLRSLLDQVPVSLLPDSAKPALAKMKSELSSVIGSSLVRSELLTRYLQTWYRHIDELELPAPGRDRGALWSKLSGLWQGEAGDVVAESIARAHGRTTLEVSLQQSKFAEKYKLAVAQLAEKLGCEARDLWEPFGRQIWTRVSLKYTQTLEGRVAAYVRLGGKEGVDAAVMAGRDPIFIDELWEISEALLANSKITSVEVIDVVSGKSRIMSRDDVIKAAKFSH